MSQAIVLKLHNIKTKTN